MLFIVIFVICFFICLLSIRSIYNFFRKIVLFAYSILFIASLLIFLKFVTQEPMNENNIFLGIIVIILGGGFWVLYKIDKFFKECHEVTPTGKPIPSTQKIEPTPKIVTTKKIVTTPKIEPTQKIEPKKVAVVQEINKDILNNIENFNKDILILKKSYIANRNYMEILEKYKYTYAKIKKQYKEIPSELAEFVDTIPKLKKKVVEWNKNFVFEEIERMKDFFSNIDGKSLDAQQMEVCVTDEDNVLVLAGAGCGKTMTIAAKVKYLVEKKSILPEEILLISFTNKATEEMTKRISEKLGIPIEATTFHKLGGDILAQKNEIKQAVINDWEFPNLIREYFNKDIIMDNQKMEEFVKYFAYYLNPLPIESDFKNKGKYYEKNKGMDLESLQSKYKSQDIDWKKEIEDKNIKSNDRLVTYNKEKLKSFEEVLIANFLFLHGIEYEYEAKYPFQEKGKKDGKIWKQYTPDFYLKDYDIWLEHFGINEDNRTPQYSHAEEKKYIEGMRWKRELHKKNNTKLIETYSYYNSKGILLSELTKILNDNGVICKPVNYAEIYRKLFVERNDKVKTEFLKLIQTFISLFKSKGYTLNEFDSLFSISEKIDREHEKEKTKLFLKIVKDVYVKYSEYLLRKGKIDFNDMINLSSKFIQESSIKFNYKYIIVDEYQDISHSRFNLIKTIRDKTDSKIVCVGDDWQSIYRFAGSDISLFIDFKDYLGFTKELFIEKTYRNSQSLIDIAGKYIMKNPIQKKKNLKSALPLIENPVKIYQYSKEILIGINEVVDDIARLANGTAKEILVLGRTNSEINVFVSDEAKEYYTTKESNDSNEKNIFKIVSKKYPKLRITFMNVHKSKGLEADYVMIIGLEDIITGFPNKISDDSVLNLVLTNSDSFEYSEERRLFYVALTRTRNNTYLLSSTNSPSSFVNEMIKEYKITPIIVESEAIKKKEVKCPKCKEGNLILRVESNFIGCSNYPLCDNTYTDLNILENPVICPKCGEFMVKRINRSNGTSFYSCLNYNVILESGKRLCEATKSIDIV